MSTTCSDDDMIIIDNTEEINNIKNTVTSENWQITSFIDSGVDETNDYAGYNFNFNANGTLAVVNGNEIINGTWSITDDSNSDDDSNDSNDIDFNIFFSSPVNFNDDLTDDWDIVSYSATKIELIDISGGNGGTDTLTFERN
ncbi:MAG: hypothetical protein NWQ07_06160 [Flaviramulus sp.]|nr:hypothetical protein [Flaviramulus sp.]